MAQVHPNTWDRFIGELKSKHDETRRKAALKILKTIQSAQRELPPQTFSSYYQDLLNKVLSLVQTNNDINERIGGLIAIQRLVEFRGEDVAQKTTRFHTAIKRALQSNDTAATVIAAETLGVLVRHNAALAADIVDAEVKISLEWLQVERNEFKRFAAAEVLLHLANASPTLFYGYVPQILEVIWSALRDTKNMIREAAASTVSNCFEVLSARDPQVRTEWLARTYEEINKGFALGSMEAVHGSLLTIRELLVKGGMFMQGQRYRDACDKIFNYKDHREPLIRREVVTTIPIMAAYNPKEFCTYYIHRSMLYLQGLMKSSRGFERNISFQAVGKIAHAIQSAIAPYLDSIILLIREALSVKNRGKAGDDAAIFECLSMISIAVGQTLSKYMEALLDPIFACGLSEALTQALVDMAHYIPPVKGIIQEKLLDMLSRVLCGRAFQLPGHPGHANSLPSIYTKDMRDRDPLLGEHKELEVRLALQTLGSFDFSGHVLNEFVHDVAIRYVEDDDAIIRKNAALTCCQLLVKDPIVNQSSRHAIKVVGDVVEKLLTLAVADPDIDNRKIVLSALDRRFDVQLSKAENIRTLFIAVNDEVFAIREEAMRILGRLTNKNPAYVFPSLRKVLIQLLTEIEYSNNARNKEESAKLVSCLASAASKLTKPYVDSMVTCLLPKTQDTNPEVASTTLRAIGDLAAVGGEEMSKFIPDLMHVVIRDLQDQSSISKRKAALTTLGQLASHSGYVIDPYIEHPELLDILVNMVKSEPAGELRAATIRLMGILGALDPYRHQVMEQSPEKNLIAEAQNVTDVTLIMGGMTPSNDDYYATMVVQTLVTMLREPALMQHHTTTIEAIMSIYTTLGLKCVPFLKDVVPGILGVLNEGDEKRREACFSQLATLVRIVKQHIRPHLQIILTAIQEHWKEGSGQQATMLALIESIANAIEGEFNVYLARVLPLMLDVLEHDTTLRRTPSERVLRAFLIFGSSAEEYMHLIIPVMVGLFDRPGQPVPIAKTAMETIAKLSRSVNISEFAARIIHPLGRILAGPEATLKQTALDTICALIFQLGREYLHFVPTIRKILLTHRVPHQQYSLLVTKLQKGESLPDFGTDERSKLDSEEQQVGEMVKAKLAVNQQHLKAAWESSSKATREDWIEWFRRLSTELIRESPQQALRACSTIANIHAPLARALFNSAFVSCWTELYENYQEELVRAIETAMTSPQVPPEIIQILLSLAEFMEHDDKALPIDVRTLGMYAGKCHAFAKALHYKELEFNAEQNASAVEALISINNQLQQTDAAFGILRKAQGYNDVDLKESWFEKLQRWEEALQAYQKREREVPDSFDIIQGKMRCLHALGEWDVLSSLAQEKWIQATSEQRRDIAALATAAAWGMGQWELMDNYLQVMKSNSPDRSFFGAILAIHRDQFNDAHAYIARAREGLDTELSALLGESYTRAYSVIVRVQMLAELEEIIVYKQSTGRPEKQEQMRNTWSKRLQGCQRNVEVWQRMLKVRALVIKATENEDMYIKFASICRKSQRNGLAEKALNSLINHNGSLMTSEAQQKTLNAPYAVQYAVYKFMWSVGAQDQALVSLREFADRLKDDFEVKSQALTQTANHQVNGINGVNGHAHVNGSVNGLQNVLGNGVTERDLEQLLDWQKLLARSYLKQGDWLVKQQAGDWQSEHVTDILNCYRQATRYNHEWYKAWHAWALANFEVATSLTAGQDRESAHVSSHTIDSHIVPAIHGFFRSIALSNFSALQDTLRLLTLWFAHGNHQEVTGAVTQGMSTVSIDTWLEVMPQLIARINQSNRLVRNSVHNLLCEIGRLHPQALVYPLTVAVKSDSRDRSKAAKEVMATIEQHSPELCEQAGVVSHELIRIAVLWHELWHEGLEEASRLYFGDENVEGFFRTLEPLHQMLDDGAQTLREISFIQSFGRDLQEARDWCNAYKNSNDKADLQQAWDLYYQVFKRISKQLPQLSNLELQYVSPRLKNLHDLELAVPGTYKSGKTPVRIVSFDPNAAVIQSKQRPRKLTLVGSDGVKYSYALKGHEDIRQDERVMQLFGLCNTLLANDPECLKRHLNIQRFSAIPLSTQSGLLGWVPNSDTLHALIKEYRESRKILLNIEHRIMLQMAPDYDNLTLMQKVEVFGYALDNTTGQDLYRVLWLKSKSSEAWLDRRTNYTRSLAVMSMVGYILGLGDRHPSNLMLDRTTGKIIHIDFGDCFEIAMHREKYPERVPFRLTRMLTFAMEVSNIEGSFRTTCEHVMRVLRSNKESLIAVLEAFIHDPLLTWRLNVREAPSEPGFRSERRASIMGDLSTSGGSSVRMPARPRAGTLGQRDREEQQGAPREVQNARALQVLARVKEKLTGRDFKRDQELSPDEQVEKLLSEATNLENLCQHYIGWCSFW
ncbi:TOR1 phosphatidylinositol 3-kinase [Myriangium duriaei CBS 260.36]|uniref:Serine/threonine-protein kinase TOR n=1 Tax=Myriangium duriaei CBS 260.36 TaxID=1168546 RepID=A0A9P4J118_9PEZI|nr:TOR1 phosphatidylinositol 3-kinase [Myriangium duriaei CBS 260.36]